jgi:biopolymer transport protein TolQ
MDSVLPVYLATVAAPEPAGFSIIALILQADIVVQLVLFTLVAMSVACWTIILNKWTLVRRAGVQSQEFVDMFWKAQRLDQVYERAGKYSRAPVAEVFRAGYVELSKLTTGDANASAMDLGLTENIERALRRTTTVELAHLERLVPFLATTGSTAPFIGLFGTVWGILRAFQRIGATGQASIATVGPDIAHALVATAVGLLAAIPAVMAYNYFNTRIRTIHGEIDAFCSDFLNIVRRHYRGR